jgi:hypothetical protein
MIFLDRSLDSLFQPSVVYVDIGAIELVINLERHICEERWLGATEIIATASVEDLAVMPDLENKMFYHSLRHADLSIYQETKGNEVRIPIIQLSKK